ncbi:MAG: hypothetical protein OEW75_01395, partial [Cyclobacteriaceae bacterium]|nr:hypothetical protein [Cyclobacteriaceae bacterium]
MQINFQKNILPHLISVVVFYMVTMILFRPAFTGNKDLNQPDINQWQGASKELRDYRDQTGNEGLWADAMFSGMPAYLVNVEWDDQILTNIKIAGSLFIPHPYRNIFLAMLSFYILLLVFRVNPYLSIPFALAFGLSSYLVIGVIAGHNARIGAIAFVPLVFAGIHYCLHYKYKLGGLALSTLAISLHLRENHLQITYYILLIGLFYILFYLIKAYKEKSIKKYLPGIGILALAGIIALGTFFGKFWSTYEYSKYSIRGKSELRESLNKDSNQEGLSKSYAFQYSNGILEPMTLFIPDFFGGSAGNYLVSDQNSKVYQALSRSDNPEMAQQLARYSSSYWGNQSYSAPYYAGAIIVFLAVLGLFFAPSEAKWWLVATSILGIMLSWGDTFESFNYFMFDYFPGYNKFRSVTFALLLPLFALPLLGALGLSGFLNSTEDKNTWKKFWMASGIAGGFCLLVVMFAGLASFMKEGESQLPNWFLFALQDDRESLMRSDALRSLGFIAATIALLFLYKKEILKSSLVYGILTLIVFLDMYLVDKRYLINDLFVRKSIDQIEFTKASEKINADKSDFRVYNIAGDALSEGRTSYYHASVGGYHGAKLRRYQELFEHCVNPQTQELYTKFGSGDYNIESLGA